MRKPSLLASEPGFRRLLMAAAIAAFALILLGILVSATGSGRACPDWPTCFGSLAPPAGATALPYLHRLAAGLLAGLLLGGAWLARRRKAATFWLLLGALALLGAQALLGAALAGGGAAPAWKALHFGLALGIQGLALAAAAFACAAPANPFASDRSSLAPRLSFRQPFARLSLAALGALFALLVSGSWVAAAGSGPACAGWPLCSGGLFPSAPDGWAAWAHRAASALSGLLMALLLAQAWRTQRDRTAVLVATTSAAVLFGAQALMGSVEVAQGFPAHLRGLHAATAAGVWTALALQALLAGLAEGDAAHERCEAHAPGGRSLKVFALDFLALTKPVVVALLLVTAFAGMVVAGQAWPPARLVFWTLLGGAMAAGGSGAINQYIDRFDDEKMQRTARRPIPAGRLTAGEGLAFGVALALGSFYVMAAFVNFLAALLALAGIVYYVVLYSLMLKKATVQNIVIGGGAGAIPPLVGWAAVTGSLNVPALFLFAVIFLWTPPHFWALALVRRRDYARAGVPMLPVVRGERAARGQIFLYTVELVILTLLLPLFGLGGAIYLVSAAFLGGALLFSAWKVWRGEGNRVAWKMYRHSSLYLAFLFLALVVDALV